MGPFLERLQGEKNRTGVRRVRKCRPVEANKGGDSLDRRVLENFSAGLVNNFIGPVERGAGRKLKRRNQITSIKLRDEPGGGRTELSIRERNQAAIGNQENEGNSNKPSGQPAVARRKSF